ncbi:MAG: DUF123 domain-containing protein [Planctomycetaceae bacterium]|jgi:hypothetical protein|nr:DUF123 domain-containing protein [Planctomycetaceae bacterium]
MERQRFPFKKDKIPDNGIYILFESGEIAHSVDRIVRVGTHRGENRLYSRLEEHFSKENKDRSILRKNIGMAILNKNNDSFLKYWEIDLTTKAAKEKYLKEIDMEKQKRIEKEVTNYIQSNISFVVFGIDDQKDRSILEKSIISTISLCNKCKQSEGWLGNYSPKEKIMESGLWLEQGLGQTPLNDKEINYMENIIINK